MAYLRLLLLKTATDGAHIPCNINPTHISALEAFGPMWEHTRVYLAGGATLDLLDSLDSVEKDLEDPRSPRLSEAAPALLAASKAYIEAIPTPRSRKGSDAWDALWSVIADIEGAGQ